MTQNGWQLLFSKRTINGQPPEKRTVIAGAVVVPATSVPPTHFIIKWNRPTVNEQSVFHLFINEVNRLF